MKRVLLLVLSVMAAFAAFSQTTRGGIDKAKSAPHTPAYHKMSPFVREAALQAPAMAARAKSLRPLGKMSTLTAFVRVDGSGDDVLSDHGCDVLARFGDIYIASIPLQEIAALSADNRIERIEAGRPARVQMDTTRQIVNAAPVCSGDGLPQAYTGRGVIVGVQDIGFDLTHPTFYSADQSRYRIMAMWDQLSKDTIGSSLPVGRDYVGTDALLAVGRSYDGMTMTHGTHTAGTAAGSGAEGGGVVSPYVGMAPDADICLVANATGNNASLIDSVDLYKYTYAVDALGFKYIFDYADSQNKPCVINFSEGSSEDFQGYDQLYYAILDSLTGPGHIIVASAGNDGDNINHIRKARGQESAGIFCASDTKTSYVTTKSNDSYTLRYKIYADASNPVAWDISIDRVLASRDSLLRDTLRLPDHTYTLTAQAYPSCYDASETVCDWMITGDVAPFGISVPVALQLLGRDADVEVFRVNGYLYPNVLDRSLSDGDHTYSVNSPSSAPSVISVGSTGHRASFVNYLGERQQVSDNADGIVSSFSGTGPTYDGRTKPDVTAPGEAIISSFSSFVMSNPDSPADRSWLVRQFDDNGRTYGWSAASGTSMSSPVVAGAIALWLEANPRLTPADCIDIFRKTCKRNETVTDWPDIRYGNGEIDVYAGIEEALRRQTDGIVTMTSSDNQPDDRIYSLDGRYVGRDSSALPRGIYIKAGKKILK